MPGILVTISHAKNRWSRKACSVITKASLRGAVSRCNEGDGTAAVSIPDAFTAAAMVSDLPAESRIMKTSRRQNARLIVHCVQPPWKLRTDGPDPSCLLCVDRCYPALQGAHSLRSCASYFYGVRWLGHFRPAPRSTSPSLPSLSPALFRAG